MAHFYLDDSLAAQSHDVGSVVFLRGTDARHAATVARVRPGERLRLGDGAGLVLHGTVTSVDSAEVALEVEHVDRSERPTSRIHLVQALAKGDRDELAVQAATELGVDVVVPWQAARSISRWDSAKAVKGRERWATIAREASKQSLRGWLPEVQAVASTKELLERVPGTTMLVLDPDGDTPLSSLRASDLGDRDIVLVVGPEGGISADELSAFVVAGARRVRLGVTVLRTSTAGPAAIAALSATLGRW